jgi:enoyl-CoA hydratase/carnithine racemase
MDDRVQVTIAAGGAEVRMVRPDKMNVLDVAMFEAIVVTAARLGREKGLRAVVLSGEGSAFCAGLDIGRFAAMKEQLRHNCLSLGLAWPLENCDSRVPGHFWSVQRCHPR